MNKYSLKTAIRIVSEEDRHDLIPFFEHIRWNCNIGYWEVSQIDIGEIWFIDKEGLLTFHDKTDDLSDYTISEGIPENWREEMENNFYCSETENNGYKCEQQCERCAKTDNIDVLEQKSRINQLESEKKELIERLNKSGNNLIEECGKTAKLRDKNIALKQRVQELEEENKSLKSDRDMLDFIQYLMTDDSDYCEVYLSGLRNFTGKATAYQFETNPEKIPTINKPTLREAILAAMEAKQLLK